MRGDSSRRLRRLLAALEAWGAEERIAARRRSRIVAAADAERLSGRWELARRRLLEAIQRIPKMHTGEVRGEYTADWRPTKATNPSFVCRVCGSDDVWFRSWESSCGGYDDTHYKCRGCQREWWVEGPDA